MKEEETQSEQRTLDWQRARLGNFTGSKIHELMTTSRTPGMAFGKTALSYIYSVIAERHLKESIVADDDLFAAHLDRVDITKKEMRWGTTYEPFARSTYAFVKECEVYEVGSVKHPDFEHYAASPDGIIYENDVKGILEFKCPSSKVYLQYRTITDTESLKKMVPEYYWQMQAEMDCTNAQFGHFVAYDPEQDKEMHIVRIERNQDDINIIHERITLAEEFIKEYEEKYY